MRSTSPLSAVRSSVHPNHPPPSILHLRSHRDFAVKLLRSLCVLLLTSVSAPCAVQQAWVAKYNSGPGSTNPPVGIALDAEGNIYVAGSSTRATAPYDLDYIVIKYSPSGAQLWADRFGSPGIDETVKAMAVSTNGDVFVTGTSNTMKCFSSGLIAWTAPYAGRDITVDANGNSYVTGFSGTDFSLVKIDAFGSNVWLRTWDLAGYNDVSQVVAVDGFANCFIAGLATVVCDRAGCTLQAYMLKYSSAGELLWATLFSQGPESTLSSFNGFACDNHGYLYGAIKRAGAGGCCSWGIRKIDAAGGLVWSTGLSPFISEGVRSMSLDSQGDVYTTGTLTGAAYNTFKVTADGSNVWDAEYPGTHVGENRAYGVTADSTRNAYVTGQSTGDGTGNDYATVRYGTNGQQLWVQRYSEPGNSDDQAHAIAVSPNGDVYVTGFSNPSPGTYEITTIKYVQVAPIEKKSNGSIFLSLPGTPGSNYTIQACSVLTNWTNIGSVTCNPSGLYTFEDTNAPAYRQRFYRTLQE